MANDYSGLVVTRSGQVATIGMRPAGDVQYVRGADDSPPLFFPKHKQLGLALEELRADNSIRVIVLTGLGDVFFVPPSGAPGPKSRHNPGEDWDLTVGQARTLQAFVEIESRLSPGQRRCDRVRVPALPLRPTSSPPPRTPSSPTTTSGWARRAYGRSVFVPMHMPPAITKRSSSWPGRTRAPTWPRSGSSTGLCRPRSSTRPSTSSAERLLLRSFHATRLCEAGRQSADCGQPQPHLRLGWGTRWRTSTYTSRARMSGVALS